MARINIPAALRPYLNEKRWVIWRKEVRNDKPTKVPYQARVYQSGEALLHAKTHDPSTWCDAPTALNACQLYNCDGIGINIAGSDLACFFLNDCPATETGAIQPFANDLRRQCNSYCEVTPSERGLRIIGK